MASKYQPRSEGVNVTSDLPPTLHILLKKTLPKNNVVVGDDRAQVRFLEQRLSHLGGKTIEVTKVDRVTDDMLAGYEDKLYQVSMKHKADLSPELRGRTGIWAADPIVKGSAAINTLVKFAATRIPGREKTLKREIIDRVGDEICKKPVQDVRAAIWKAVWMLSGDLEPNDKWLDPWEHPTNWLTNEMNVGKRLNSLYKKLVRYSIVTLYGEEAASKEGIRPSQQQYFKGIHLDPTKAHDTIVLLSRYREGRISEWICAFQIAVIWGANSSQ
jgi:hypothetical protein